MLILGLTFKENCPDLRNTRVIDVVRGLEQYGVDVDVHDPWANSEKAKEAYGVDLVNELKDEFYDAIVIAVAHDEYKKTNIQSLRRLGKDPHVFYDLKSCFRHLIWT